MKNIKLTCAILVVLGFLAAIILILNSKHALVFQPKGPIAHQELHLIKVNYLLMFTIAIPTFIFLFVIAWRYRSKNSSAKYQPEHKSTLKNELLMWGVPSVIVAVMMTITWFATHKLDPYKPITSDVKPVTIQVMALDWKWLFIYPEQGIASINFVQFPAGVPIHFKLSADHSPMNSFWIPELSGQIYAMAGMITQLHMMADHEGEFPGRAAEINGEGYASMTFTAKATTQSDFDQWISDVKREPLQLEMENYRELAKPTVNHPVTYFSKVEDDLFHKVVMNYMFIHKGK